MTDIEIEVDVKVLEKFVEDLALRNAELQTFIDEVARTRVNTKQFWDDANYEAFAGKLTSVEAAASAHHKSFTEHEKALRELAIGLRDYLPKH